jgi:hypothetical protein
VVKAFGSLRNVFLIVPVVLDDDVHHAVKQSHVTAEFVINGNIGKTGQMNIARIRDNEPGTPVFGPQDPSGHQGMAGRGVGADDENTAGVFDFCN